MAARLESQELASRAYERVTTLANKDLEELRKLPSHIQASGLGQTVAFYLKKNGNVANALVSGLPGGGTDGIAFLKKLMGETTAGQYRVMTRRALAYASWLKRFADARLNGG